MELLSWDCAHITLAWSHVILNTNFKNDLIALNAQIIILLNQTPCDEWLVQVENLMMRQKALFRDLIQVKSSGVADVLNGKKMKDTSAMDRTRAIWAFLNPTSTNTPTQGSLTPTQGNLASTQGNSHPNFKDISQSATVLIENQPAMMGFGANSRVNTKSNAVAQQLALWFCPREVILMDPNAKNTIALSPDLTLDVFLNKYKKAYTARKEHSKANFLYFVKVMGIEHILKGVALDVYDDLADSFMQMIAFIVKNKLLCM
jgi:hypothetical protein